MNALLIGATGATGSDLLQLLLKDSEVESVTIFVRRDPLINHPKLKVHLIDFTSWPHWSFIPADYTIFVSTAYFTRAAVLGTCSLAMMFLR